MNEWLRTLFSLSLSGAGLAAVAALFSRLLRGRVPYAFRCYLWLLVLLRFVCPFGPEGGLTPRLMDQARVVLIQEAVPEYLGASENGTEPGAEQGSVGDVPPKAESGGDLPVWAFPLWLAGAAGLTIFRTAGYLRLCRRLHRGKLPVQPWERELLCRLWGEHPGMPGLVRSCAAETPMLAGLFRPCVYLPAGPVSREELDCALRHELAHCRRRDLPCKWAVSLVVSLHWFNPAVWLVERAVSRDCELACDEAAVRDLSRGERAEYGRALLQTAQRQSLDRGFPAASFQSEKQCLKERLCAIMNPMRRTKKSVVLLTAAVVALMAVSVSLGAYTGGGEEADAEKTPVQAVPAPGLSGQETKAPEELDWPFAQRDEIAVSMLFGTRVHPITGRETSHSGIDIVLERDTPVLAAAAGTVSQCDYDSALGNYVVVDHGGGLTTLYAQLTQNDFVSEGETVEAGTQIGTVGRTGQATGYHLHFEVALDGEPTNPLEYFPDVRVAPDRSGAPESSGI